MIEIARGNDGFETYIMRPGGILPENTSMVMSALASLVPSIRVDQLARVMVAVALNGCEEQTLENGAIKDFKV